ncbi:helix-turn-helix domain-containing protein [Pseudodesulfovibrio pelocollis]|uniref:helix-turn-helix domain-containing protein n=1 Tax=Pseudodesulfovibrio pelocollis TaxID=3051432 RepID=UPI003CE49627
MNIREDIKKMLRESGWTQGRLADESGVKQSTISKIVTGASKGGHSETLRRLWPFLYGDRHPSPVPGQGQSDDAA